MRHIKLFPNEKSKKITKIIIASIIIIFLFIIISNIISGPEAISELTAKAGVWGPIVLIVIITLGILFSPLPSVIIIIIAGYIYGPVWGGIYSYIGHVLSAIIPFTLYKLFKIKDSYETNKHKKYTIFINKHLHKLYLLYILPLIPISITSLVLASTKMKFKKFIKIVSLSFIPTIIFFSIFGNRLSSSSVNEIIIWSGVIIIMIGYLIYKLKKSSDKK